VVFTVLRAARHCATAISLIGLLLIWTLHYLCMRHPNLSLHLNTPLQIDGGNSVCNAELGPMHIMMC
jgi:hypothetical protein